MSVELLDRPELVGKPVAAAQDTARSVVSSASYEARRFGVRSAMPVARAKQLCPQLVLVPPVFEKYRVASREVMRIFGEYTPLVEPLSIDEAFLDVAGSVRLFGSPAEIARQLRERIRTELGLPASVGLAGTKFVAKLASQRAKPDGVLEIPPERTLGFLHPLPVGAMWGVGQATAKSLMARAIHTVADLAAEPVDSLRRIVGTASADRLHELANGRDTRGVQPERVEKSVGHEETFEFDEPEGEVLRRELLRLSTRVGERLRDRGLSARTVAIKLRWSSFETITRSRTLPEPTNASQRIYLTARELFDEAWGNGQPVRLIGVRAEQLGEAGDSVMGLWDDDEHMNAIDQAVDSVRDRFGAAGLAPASLLKGRGTPVDPRSLQAPR